MTCRQAQERLPEPIELLTVPVLSKPFSPEDLRQAVRQALAKSNGS